MGKKKFLVLIILGILIPGSGFAMGTETSIGERFSGETVKYSVGFWLIDPVGRGTAEFRNVGGGKYVVYHEGKTEGIVAWLTRNRKEIYQSTMTTVNSGKRLIPLCFEEYSVIGEWVRKKTTTYDYEHRKVIIELEKEGQAMPREEVEIPFGAVYDDPVTAFYNFRFGVYGTVEQGKEYLIRTLPRMKEEVIRIRVLSEKETEIRRAEEKDNQGKDLLIRISLDREMWGRRKGEMDLWFNRDLVPMSGVVRDVPFFGDIKGRKEFYGFPAKPGS